VNPNLGQILRDLADPFSPYYSQGHLNNEGLAALEVLAREVLKEKPWLRERFRRARRSGNFERVHSLLKDLLEVE
jgi:hypothetical protein